MSSGPPAPTAAAVRSACEIEWGLASPSVEPLVGPGLCSETWAVSNGDGRWVAKAIPNDAPHRTARFALGLRIARELASDGFRTGCPRPARNGEVVGEIQGWSVALLEFEPGARLDVTDEGAAVRVGALLGQLHQRLQRLTIAAPPWTPEEDFLSAPSYSLRPGLHDLAAEVVEAARLAADRLRVGWIHGDLNADEILIDPTGGIAVVDWGAVHAAPQLLDLITFHDEDCFPALLRGYFSSCPDAELEREALPALERFHWLRQTAFWGGRMLQPFRDAETKQGYTNEYAFERSYEILVTGRWRH